jgi:O-succinylbenzoate synthase
MGIALHRYQLVPQTSPNRLSGAEARQGCLLRVHVPEWNTFGHADLFPWPELGDAPLEVLLSSLKSKPLPQAQAALAWARFEAKAQFDKVAFFPAHDVLSHETLTVHSPTLASRVKVKVASNDPKSILQMMEGSPATTFRLDFNGLFSDLEEARVFWGAFPDPLRERIEFVEDPMVEGLMPKARDVFHGTLVAVDRSPTPENLASADVRVLKPVYFPPDELPLFAGPMVVTSNMDHPLGQIQALHAAHLLKARGQTLLEGGLLTQDLYLEHAQQNWVTREGSALRVTHPHGYGWGLHRQLEALKWEQL